MTIKQTLGRPKIAPFKPLDQILGETVKKLAIVAWNDRHKLLAEFENRPKTCSICGKGWTYTYKQKYKLASGETVTSKNNRESWYKYGKYGYMCKKCSLDRTRELRKMRGQYKIG